jgi:hypothetical protein
VKSDHPQVASLAAIVLEVARIKPYKTRRLKFLAQKFPELLRKLEDARLFVAHTWDRETTEIIAQTNSEETKVFVPEATDLPFQEDWEIPFD